MEETSLAQAAEKLYVSQSTVSYRLNELEENMGFKLINREQGKRTITLTPKGEDFISIADRWIALEKETNQWKSKEISDLNLNIGTVDSLNTFLFHSLYRKILKGDSPLSLNVTAQLSINVYNLLKAYEIDIGLPLRYINFNNIITKPIFKERMVLVSSNDKVRFNDFVQPGDLDPTKEIYIDLGSNLEKWRDYWFGRHLEPKFLVIDSAGLLFKMLEKSDNWAVVPISVANDFREKTNISISELEGETPYRICYLAKHKSPKSNTIKSIKIFEKHLYDFIENNPNLERLE